MRFSVACAGFALLLAGAAVAQEISLQVELMGPLSAQSSRKGDRVFARVVSPEAFKGDMVEGKVSEARAGGKIRGTSVLNFSFETLQHSGSAISISSQVTSIANSKGQTDVDEEGRVLRKTNNTGRAATGSAVGGMLGGLAGGRRGALVGAGAGAAASIILIQVAAEGPDIRLDPGSRVTLSAKSRSGPSLASLAPGTASSNAPPAATTSASSPSSAGTATATTSASAEAPVAAAGTPASAAQPNFTALKDEFIPGSRILLYDDFTDMAFDEAPPHWKVRGGSLTLMSSGEVRQVMADRRIIMTAMVSSLPVNFTVESEVKYDGYATSGWYFFPKDSNQHVLQMWMEGNHEGTGLRVYVRTSKEMIADNFYPTDLKQPVKQAIWVQNGRLRVFLNGQRVADANQVELPPIEQVQLIADPSDNYKGKLAYRLVRIAESTPDFSRSIASSGRYVTHGILFDTGSDRLKPESVSVIRVIARSLEASPDLKLKIEGHTDSTGSADQNMDLSKRRAEAVKTVLVSQFGINAERLTSEGLGPSKPIDSNDTPTGRAQNRRVEFVKM